MPAAIEYILYNLLSNCCYHLPSTIESFSWWMNKNVAMNFFSYFKRHRIQSVARFMCDKRLKNLSRFEGFSDLFFLFLIPISGDIIHLALWIETTITTGSWERFPKLNGNSKNWKQIKAMQSNTCKFNEEEFECRLFEHIWILNTECSIRRWCMEHGKVESLIQELDQFRNIKTNR